MTPESALATRQRIQRVLHRERFEHTQAFERLKQTSSEWARMQTYCIDDTCIAKNERGVCGRSAVFRNPERTAKPVTAELS